ncbi:DUF3306 domain-containing protein [Azospirillum sp. HJ39]|uniref:DUF3306 domain-containing protein n=1 Tax=Azospirillum sp. HJ39 TaxID=3159496 RepID=UPI00355867A5
MSGEAFLSRWSRLKRTAVKPEPAPEDMPPADRAVMPPASVAAEAADEAAGEFAKRTPADSVQAEGDADPAVATDDPLADLPPVEELTADSDFTPFLRAEVPEDLHRQALRKLWTSDPIYANDDGLKDYADDYASLFTGEVPVKTLYRVGKGFLDTLDEVADEVAEAADPAPVPAEGGEPDPECGEAEDRSKGPEPV